MEVIDISAINRHLETPETVKSISHLYGSVVMCIFLLTNYGGVEVQSSQMLAVS